ncbi:MAG TPA: type IV pilus twitching motility protein PilT [Acidobacteriota bacterium]|nr:type IV pilus twitching motility protein PilT [Acidobacteriota bacterium]
MSLDLHSLLKATMDAGASDLHLATGQPPLIRHRGNMVRSQATPLDGDQARDLIYSVMSDEHRRAFERGLEVDFAFEIPGVARFRANVFRQRHGISAVYRVIVTKIRTLEELHAPPILRDLAMKERGLVLVTGPTGSGKSTTLAAMIHHVNEHRQGHIVTIEDPIEFVHESRKCLVQQREVGTHTESFAAALRSALREDPDILLVGELRDLETTALAITAAETGHLVFGTLHTNSAAKTIDRLIDIFPGDRQAQIRTMLSESLEGVIAQTLLPSADGKGRVAALEILVGVPALRNLIREGKTTQIASVMQVGAQHGMQTLDQAIMDLFASGKITKEEAQARTNNPRLVEAPPAAGSPNARPSGRLVVRP